MADFKTLHDKWKKAKKEAKDWYGNYEKLFMDVSLAHEEVKLGAPPFPAFKKDLGPSLDKIHAKKDVKTYKGKAETAVKQYEQDIKKAVAAVSNKERAELAKKAKNGPGIITLALQKLKALEEVREEIEKELKNVKV